MITAIYDARELYVDDSGHLFVNGKSAHPENSIGRVIATDYPLIKVEQTPKQAENAKFIRQAKP